LGHFHDLEAGAAINLVATMERNVMNTPAGWYPQPDGQQRYWDGQQWTGYFAPTVAPMVAQGGGIKGWFMRRQVENTVGGVLLLLLLIRVVFYLV
jgi:hypothetical protein